MNFTPINCVLYSKPHPRLDTGFQFCLPTYLKSICKHNKHLYIASSRLLKKLQRKPDQEYQHIKFTSLTPLILTVNSLLATQVSGQLCVYSRLHSVLPYFTEKLIRKVYENLSKKNFKNCIKI